MNLPGEKLDSNHFLYKEHLVVKVWSKIWINNTTKYPMKWRGPYDNLDDMEKAITK
jgi:hypothetical protein